MREKVKRILIVESNPQFAQILQSRLTETNISAFDIAHCDRLVSALQLINEQNFDLILLDLDLPDSQRLITLARVHSKAPDTPIVVLGEQGDLTLAISSIHMGAQDYLTKEQANTSSLARIVLCAIERHRRQISLDQSLFDELTGLYNRRGFLAFAEQHLKLAAQRKRGLLLLLVDFENLRQIDEAFGHYEGNKALVEAANIIKDTFRGSDIAARISGNEFAILAIDARKDSAEIISSRLMKNLNSYNSRAETKLKLIMSVGVAHFDPEMPCSVDELVDVARRKKMMSAL